MYNKSIIQGNLARDPESKTLGAGTTVCSFAVATNRKYTANGEKREETSFIPVEAFGKQAELITQYFHKGDPILLDGHLKQDTWEKDGTKHTIIKVVLENFSFIGGKAPQQ